MHATDLFAEADQPAVETALSEAFETGQTTTEVELVTAAGDTCSYEFRTRRLTDVDGEAVGLVGVGRDVSATKRHQRRLERQATQFESFGSVLSHDLATPLNTLSGRLELAREVTTGGEQHFAAAARALERIETLIDDLATAMQQGQLVDDPEPVDLAATVRSCWALLDTETEAATLRIVDSDSMYADEEAVLRLIENLLHNAVDHAGPDVTVRVGTTPDGFYVADDGPGIPPGERADVLEPGYTTTDDGTGFGLASVDHVAMAHGWALEITDSWADGARFEFTDVEWV
jgi:signal transduction histidine kinase